MIPEQYTALKRALEVVRASEGRYPPDEVQWLYAFCHNKGIELFK